MCSTSVLTIKDLFAKYLISFNHEKNIILIIRGNSGIKTYRKTKLMCNIPLDLPVNYRKFTSYYTTVINDETYLKIEIDEF